MHQERTVAESKNVALKIAGATLPMSPCTRSIRSQFKSLYNSKSIYVTSFSQHIRKHLIDCIEFGKV